jgi:hypothetical protein
LSGHFPAHWQAKLARGIKDNEHATATIHVSLVRVSFRLEYSKINFALSALLMPLLSV